MALSHISNARLCTYLHPANKKAFRLRVFLRGGVPQGLLQDTEVDTPILDTARTTPPRNLRRLLGCQDFSEEWIRV